MKNTTTDGEAASKKVVDQQPSREVSEIFSEEGDGWSRSRCGDHGRLTERSNDFDPTIS